MISNSAKLEQLEGYFELIDNYIESKKWDELNDVLIRRQDILEELCSLPLSSYERDTVLKVMTMMQMTDRQFITVVQAQKKVLQKQAASLAHDRKAIQAYQIE